MISSLLRFCGDHLLGFDKLAGDQVHAGLGQRLRAHVATSDDPLIVLLGEHGPGQSDEGGPVGAPLCQAAARSFAFRASASMAL